MIHGHLSGQLTQQCFWWGSELENWTAEFVQRTTNLEKQSPGLCRSEDHRQGGLSVTVPGQPWEKRALSPPLGEAVLWAIK